MFPRPMTMFKAEPLIFSFLSMAYLYGLLLFFAIFYYLGFEWQRGFTILFYSILCILLSGLIFLRLRQYRLRVTVFDGLFSLFCCFVILSTIWSESMDRAYYLQLFPFFVFFPYLMGRVVYLGDLSCLRWGLIIFGMIICFFLLPYSSGYEYRYDPDIITKILHDVVGKDYGLPKIVKVNVQSVLHDIFGLVHGIMLTGILLSAAFISVLSIISFKKMFFLTNVSWSKQVLAYCLCLALFIFPIAIIFILSRSGILACIVGTLTVGMLSIKVEKENLKLFWIVMCSSLC